MNENTNHERLTNEFKYKQAYKVVYEMLKRGIITEEEFNFINEKFKTRYKPILAEVYN